MRHASRVRKRQGQRLTARRGIRGRALAIATITSAAAALTVAVAFAAPSKTVTIADPKADVTGPVDVQRASLSLASDGRLRVVVTLVAKLEPKALLADSGPPGSICVKVWTATDADPSATQSRPAGLRHSAIGRRAARHGPLAGRRRPADARRAG